MTTPCTCAPRDIRVWVRSRWAAGRRWVLLCRSCRARWNLACRPMSGWRVRMIHPPYNDPGPGYLGSAHTAFAPDGPCRADMALGATSMERLAERRTLLTQFDRLRKDVDTGAMLAGIDAFHSPGARSDYIGQATRGIGFFAGIACRSGPLRTGRSEPGAGIQRGAEIDRASAAGAMAGGSRCRCVTLAFGAWDWHAGNFQGMREELPLFDHGIATLVEDLHARGLWIGT